MSRFHALCDCFRKGVHTHAEIYMVVAKSPCDLLYNNIKGWSKGKVIVNDDMFVIKHRKTENHPSVKNDLNSLYCLCRDAITIYLNTKQQFNGRKEEIFYFRINSNVSFKSISIREMTHAVKYLKLNNS